LTSPSIRKEDMERFKTWLEERGFKLKSILLVCLDEAIWAERFNKRQSNPLPNQLITDFQELKRHYGDLNLEPLSGELVVDTAASLDSI
jgi:hypothetical protein